jgi:hypothetical protein
VPLNVSNNPTIDGINAVIKVITKKEEYRIKTIIILQGYKSALYGRFL